MSIQWTIFCAPARPKAPWTAIHSWAARALTSPLLWLRQEFRSITLATPESLPRCSAGELEQHGADVRFLKGGDEVCGHAMIQVDSRGQNCILIFHGSNYNIDEAYVDSVLDQFESGDMVVLQNEINTTHYIIEEAYKRGMKIALNPSL